MKFELKNQELTIDGRKQALTPVEKVVENGEGLVILLDRQKAEDNRNVIAIDSAGAVLWKIEEEPMRTSGMSSPYVGLYLEDGKLSALSFAGFKYELDSATGKILSQKYLK